MAKNQPPAPSEKPEGDTPSQERSVEEALAESNASDAIASLEKNKTLILSVVVILAVAFAGFLVMKQVKDTASAEAAAAFSSAQAKRDIAALDQVVADHSGSVAAGNALLTKADVQIDQGKSEDAKATLMTFIGDYESHPRFAQGLFAIANLSHVAGDTETAKSYYDKVLAAQPDGDLSPLTRIRLGDLALEAGDAEGAELLYNESISKHPGNPFVDKAMRKVQLAKIGDPPVVKRPEPKPEPKPEADPVPAPATDSDKGKAKAPASDENGKAKAPNQPKGKAKAKAKAPAVKGENDKGSDKPKEKAAPKQAAPKGDEGSKAKAPTSDPAPANQN